MRIGLSDEITGMLRDIASKAFALPSCMIPGCENHAISHRFKCEKCRRTVCLSHGFLRIPTNVPTEAPLVCVSCIVVENPELFEE